LHYCIFLLERDQKGIPIPADAGEPIAGDSRANEQPILTTLHTIWIREHNRVCDELAQLFPNWSDEMLYNEARNIVIAQFHNIVYEEWIPTFTGKKLPPYQGYNKDADVFVMDFFSTVAFRFGHSMVLEQYFLIDENSAITKITLKDFFFNYSLLPTPTTPGKIDALLRGAIVKGANKLDLKLIDSLRDHLFKRIDYILGLDLFAANVERGRDLRVPDYNTARKIYGLSTRKSFSEITKDKNLADKLEKLYKSINDIDAWVGTLAEDHLKIASCGELMWIAVREQFTRLRDGDRFFYLNMKWNPDLESKYKRLDLIKKGQIRFADILMRNSGVNTDLFKLPRNVFNIIQKN